MRDTVTARLLRSVFSAARWLELLLLLQPGQDITQHRPPIIIPMRLRFILSRLGRVIITRSHRLRITLQCRITGRNITTAATESSSQRAAPLAMRRLPG